MRTGFRRAAVFTSVLTLAGLLGGSALAQSEAVPAKIASAGSAGSARVLQFQSQAGEKFQAMILAPMATSVRSGAHDHIVLFDTSASQTGAHRRQALAVLDSFVQSVGEADRIRLFAIDVRPNELTTGFGTAGSENWTVARKRLRRRAPLGATDLRAALSTALNAAKESKSASVVYIGDGVSGSRLLQPEEMQAAVNEFRKARVPVSSFAVGPRKDLQVLGVLASWTGGRVLFDELENAQSPAGVKLAEASRANVYISKADRLGRSTSAAQHGSTCEIGSGDGLPDSR